MKIHASWRVLPLVTACFFVALLPIGLVEPDLDYSLLNLARGLAIALGATLLVSPLLMLITTAEIEADRVRIWSKYGWYDWHVLADGERFVISRNEIYLQRADGSLKRSRLTKWATAERDWKKVEQALPTLDVR